MKKNKMVLNAENICKTFPGVRALHNINLTLYEGEVLTILGENGAGKSTLMKIFGGIYLPDYGNIYLNDNIVTINSVQKASELGIALIHQELNLSNNLSIASNIYLGREPIEYGLIKKIKQKELNNNAIHYMEKLGLNCNPDTIVETLAIGQQQMVEIAKALSMNAKILIMDEPTSSLSQREVQILFEIIKKLKNEGLSIIYVSHRLGEVIEISDRVIVFKDGENSGELEGENITRQKMINCMIGRDLSNYYKHKPVKINNPIFEVKNLRTKKYPEKAINFHLNKGEILCIAGLVGSGRTEMLHALFGIEKKLCGDVYLEGKEILIKTPIDAIRNRIGLIPEDRRENGLVTNMSVRENTTLVAIKNFQKYKIIDSDKENNITKEYVSKLGIKCSSIEQLAKNLSGGNQQKVVLAKWLIMHPKVLFLDEPTRGVDVLAKEDIYRVFEDLINNGISLILISSELQEVIGLADRILVMHEGEITGELFEDSFGEENIIKLATGGSK